MISRTISRQASAEKCRRFRFAFADVQRLAASAKRREAVAEHVEAWMGAAIVAEQRHGSECLVTVETGRPVSVAVAERFCRECPHYIRHSFVAIAAAVKPRQAATSRPEA
jgi:hypothetical protein